MGKEAAAGKYRQGSLIHGRYRVVKLLGRGGMAEVYLVEDGEMHNRPLALKLLFPHISVEQVNIERFIREVEVTQKHSHPNIVKSFHYGKTENGEQYFTMEYIEGRNLAEILASTGKISPKDVFQFIAQTASALQAAHELGIIHRDIKPENIILTNDNLIKIADFGIAKDLNTSVKLTEVEKGPKSYAYKAPELYVDKYDHRVDIYSLGITIYELLNGELPFKGERHQLLVAHLSAPIPKFAGGKSDIPHFFQELVELCCAKKPDQRFASAAEILGFLNRYHKAAGVDPIPPLEGDSVSGSTAASTKRSIRNFTKFVYSLTSKYIISILLSLLVVFLFLPLDGGPKSAIIGDSIDLMMLDRFFRLRGEMKPPPEILIISVNESSYEKYGFSQTKPWPRAKMAELLEHLAKMRPRKIILDYRYHETIDPSPEEKLSDARLARAIAGSPTYIAHLVDSAQTYSNYRLQKRIEVAWLEPAEIFKESAKGLFLANLLDPGIVRTFYLSLGTTGGVPAVARVLFDDAPLPQTLPKPQDMINYYGPPLTLNHLSFAAALDTNRNPEIFKDKIIFVGQQLFLGYEVRQRDSFVTPYPGYMAGVEIHATAAANIIYNNWIRRMPIWQEALFIFIVSLLLSYLMISITPSKSLMLLVTISLSWLVTAYYLFKSHLFFPGMTIVLVSLPISYCFSIFKVYLEKRRADKVLGIDNLKT